MLLVDAMVPTWRERMRGPELASPYALLREALTTRFNETPAMP